MPSIIHLILCRASTLPNLFFTSAGGANFAVDTTQYLVGQHFLVVVVYNPLTEFRETFHFTFIGLLEEGKVLT